MGAVTGHTSLCQKGGFSEIDLRAPEGEETAWHALGIPSDKCDSVRIGSSGLRIECTIAPGTQQVARKPGVNCGLWDNLLTLRSSHWCTSEFSLIFLNATTKCPFDELYLEKTRCCCFQQKTAALKKTNSSIGKKSTRCAYSSHTFYCGWLI